jgi:hypothetical protein
VIYVSVMRLFVFASTLLLACGAPQKPVEQPTVVTTASATPAVAHTPPLFVGAYEITTMTDGKNSATTANIVQALHAKDGRMTWEFGPSNFTIGFWQAGELAKIGDGDDLFSAFCRASAKVDSHWEGATLVLASTVSADGEGAFVRIRGNGHAQQTASRSAKCNASFSATRIAFEIIEKDDKGPTRLRATSEGATFELLRGRSPNEIEAHKLFDQ